jgi:hypothetical protein
MEDILMIYPYTRAQPYVGSRHADIPMPSYSGELSACIAVVQMKYASRRLFGDTAFQGFADIYFNYQSI